MSTSFPPPSPIPDWTMSLPARLRPSIVPPEPEPAPQWQGGEKRSSPDTTMKDESEGDEKRARLDVPESSSASPPPVATTPAAPARRRGRPPKLPFVCPGCDQRFRFQAFLDQHLQSRRCRIAPVGAVANGCKGSLPSTSCATHPTPAWGSDGQDPARRLSHGSTSESLDGVSTCSNSARGCAENFSDDNALRQHIAVCAYGTTGSSTSPAEAVVAPSASHVCVCGKAYAYRASLYNHVKSGKCPGSHGQGGFPFATDAPYAFSGPSIPAGQPPAMGAFDAAHATPNGQLLPMPSPSRSTQSPDPYEMAYDAANAHASAAKHFVCDCGKAYLHKASVYTHKKRGACPGLSFEDWRQKVAPDFLPELQQLMPMDQLPRSAPAPELRPPDTTFDSTPPASAPTASAPDNVPRPYVCLVPGCGKAYKNSNGLAAHFSYNRENGHGELGRRLRDEASGRPTRALRRSFILPGAEPAESGEDWKSEASFATYQPSQPSPEPSREPSREHSLQPSIFGAPPSPDPSMLMPGIRLVSPGESKPIDTEARPLVVRLKARKVDDVEGGPSSTMDNGEM